MRESRMSASKLLLIAWASLILTAVPGRVSGQQRTTRSALAEPDPKGTLSLISPFLEAIYPEFKDKGAQTEVRFGMAFGESWGWTTSAGFTLWDRVFGAEQRINQQLGPGKPREVIVNRPKGLMEGSFGFDRRGRIQTFHSSNSTLLNSEKNEAISKLCYGHPEWSEAQAIQALKEAGASYGPNEKDAFREAIPLRQLERFLGKLTVHDLEFKSLVEDREGSFVQMYWEVGLVGRRPGEPPANYFLRFEPFGGKLTTVLKWPGSKRIF